MARASCGRKATTRLRANDDKFIVDTPRPSRTDPGLRSGHQNDAGGDRSRRGGGTRVERHTVLVPRMEGAGDESGR